MALCHARYSTNTVLQLRARAALRLLGHNGEINTISRFRQEARSLAWRSTPAAPTHRTWTARCTPLRQHGLDPIEALELLFPPVPHELDLMPPPLREAYTHLRHAFGPYAQGPAAIVARAGESRSAAWDALGLRPLWFIETEKEYVLSSERGVLHLETMVHERAPAGARRANRARRPARAGRGHSGSRRHRRHVAGQVHQRQTAASCGGAVARMGHA